MTKRRNSPAIIKCDHGCRLPELKKAFDSYLDDADEALDFSIRQYNQLAFFLVDHVVPYLEHKAHNHGDEDAQDLLLDLAMRVYDFRQQF